MEIVISIREEEEFTFGGSLSCISCGPNTFVCLMNDPDAGIALGKCIAKDTRLVRRPVIDEDYIKIFICLLFNCFQTLIKES